MTTETGTAVEAGPPVAVALSVDDPGWGDAAAWEAVAARAFAQAGQAATVPGAAEVSVLLTRDAAIRDLNRRFRGLDAATDVLSFPAAAMPGGGGFLGDIVLARPTVQREAAERGLTIEAHVTHLLVHGFLHIVGYDHDDAAAARRMEDLETAILARLGIDDPYRSDDRP